MKLEKLLLMIGVILIVTVSVGAQNKLKDYSGVWDLDTENSEFGQMGPTFKSGVLVVKQTDKDISIQRDFQMDESKMDGMTVVKRDSAEENFQTLKFDGTEIKKEIDHGQASGTAITSLEIDQTGGFSVVTQNSISHEMREIESEFREEWSLSGDGKTVTLYSTIEFDGQIVNSKRLVFHKKTGGVATKPTIRKIDGNPYGRKILV